MKKSLVVAEHIGIIGFFVDAKSHMARGYYEQFSFISFRERPLEMFCRWPPYARLSKLGHDPVKVRFFQKSVCRIRGEVDILSRMALV